jgi:hypothetical protein
MTHSLTILSLLCFLQACTITRYYPTKKLNGQLVKIQREMEKDLAKIETDYAKKQPLTKSKGLEDAYRNVQTSTQKLKASLAHIRQTIGKKSKVVSTDPAFKEISAFEERSKSELDVVNTSFKDYQAASNALPVVNVAQFSGELKKFIQELNTQCAKLDGNNQHVKELKKIHEELVGFQERFLKASAGQQEYLLTAEHPQFKELQKRIDMHVKAYNKQ